MGESKRPIGSNVFAILNLLIGVICLLGILLFLLGTTRPLTLFTNPYTVFQVVITLLALASAVGLLKRNFIFGYLGSNLMVLIFAGNILINLALAPAFVHGSSYFFLLYLAVFFFFLNFRYRNCFERKRASQ